MISLNGRVERLESLSVYEKPCAACGNNTFDYDDAIAELVAFTGLPAAEQLDRQRCPVCGKHPAVPLVVAGAVDDEEE